MVRYLLLPALLLSVLLPAVLHAAEERKAGPLVVYGDDFMFMVKEPEGWKADIENAPKVGAGVVFYRKRDTFERHEALIMVRIARKVDEDTKKDLAYDMRRFRTLYPDAEFGALAVKHPSYASFARVFSIPKIRYEYVVYLNPGAGVPLLFSVAMNTGSRKADAREMDAFREVVRTIEYVPQNGVKPPHR